MSFVDDLLSKLSHSSPRLVSNAELDLLVRLAVLAQGYAEGILLSEHECNLSALPERYRSPAPIAILHTSHRPELRVTFG